MDTTVLTSLAALKTRKDALISVLRIKDRAGALSEFQRLQKDLQATIEHLADELGEVKCWEEHYKAYGSSARAGNAEYRTQIAQIMGVEFEPTRRSARRSGNNDRFNPRHPFRQEA